MREGRSYEVMDEIIDALVDYAERHFAAEEELMRRTEFPGIQAHVLEHQKFYMTISRLQKQHRAGLPARSHEVVTFMQEWLKHHIMKTDRAYGEHVIAHRPRVVQEPLWKSWAIVHRTFISNLQRPLILD